MTEPLRTLAGHARTYLRDNVAEPYHGPISILRWLQGKATSERRRHLRFLVHQLGDELNENANEGNVIFAKNNREEWDVLPGTSTDAYVTLERNGMRSAVGLLGRHDVKPVLWFAFKGETPAPMVGIELYVQSSGAAIPSAGFDAQDWNAAAERHMGEKLEAFRDTLGRWCEQHFALDATVSLTAACYRGTAPNWQGGGKEVTLNPKLQGKLEHIKISEVLSVFDKHKDELWAFPMVSSQSDLQARREELVKSVRKACVSLEAQAPGIDVHASDLGIEQIRAALEDALTKIG